MWHTIGGWVLYLEGRDMKIILHVIRRIDSSLHLPNLVLFLLSLSLCCRSRYPYTTEGGLGKSVVIARLLLIRLVEEVEALECEEAGEEAIVRENSTRQVVARDHVAVHKMAKMNKLLDKNRV